MNAPFVPSADLAPRPAAAPSETARRQWAALHQAAGVVAVLAGLPVEPERSVTRNFPVTIATVGGWRASLAEQGIADLSAMMEPGLAALLAIHGQGADTLAPARTLWEEFDHARAALLALLPPPRL